MSITTSASSVEDWVSMSDSEHEINRAVRQKHTAIGKVLPPVAELIENQKYSVLRYVDLDGNEQSVDYKELGRLDNWPIPMPVDREGYGTVESSPHYWATGHGDWLNVCQAIARHCQAQPQRLLDFGCATGRFLRHVHFFSDMESYGCDFAPANVNWIRKHFKDAINIELNSAEPRLPYEDHWFDVVTAFSVFTHIDVDSTRWLDELLRITAADGLLYLTIQNQASWNKVMDRPGSFEHLSRANRIAGNIRVDEDLFQNKMPSNRIVFKMSEDDVYNCNVWCSDQYVRDNWLQNAELLGIANNAHTGFQSVVMLRPFN